MTRREQGAGLGLAVAKRVIDQAGGSIGFSSQPGEGAQFFFTLPVSGTTRRDKPRAMNRTANTQRLPVFAADVPAHARNRRHADRHAGTLRQSRDPGHSLAEAVERAGKEHFDAIISCAGDADMLAAAPGVKAPLIAVLLRGDRAPAATDSVLRWPVEACQLYRAIERVRLAQETQNPQTRAG